MIVIVKMAVIFIYVAFAAWTIYRVSKLAESRSWYKYNIMAVGLPMWAMCTLIAVWFACPPSDHHSKWLCFGWFALYILPICLWLACLCAKILGFLMKVD